MPLKKVGAGIVAAGALATGGTVAVDQAIINPYDDKGTHYELPIVSDIPQDEKVLIAKDRAAMTLTGWRGEYAITIEPQIPTSLLGAVDKPFVVEASRPLLSKRMEYKSGDVTAFIELKEGTENEAEIGMILQSRPETDTFCYKIEGTEQFEWYKQLALTQEEIDLGSERPDNVVNSFAVYHSTKANHEVSGTNYATGKVFHRYRARAEDADGNWTWAEDSDYSDGIVCDIFPTKWLDTAIYPVRI